MSRIIQAESLSRFYGMILGLNNVSFSIQPGITGIVGPNGAGKTTLFRLLLGQIRPSSGRLLVFGESPWNNPRVQSRIAYCPESEQVPALRPLDWLIALGMISGHPRAAAEQQAVAALDLVKLGREHWRKRITAYSKGMRQRVKLAQCLIHHPSLVILDEPMNGLDPMGREDIGNVLRHLAAKGTSVLISSHILHDLESLCGDFLFLRWGRIPRSMNDAAGGPDGRERWPESTTIRCASPEALARFLFERNLVRGCDIVSVTGTLNVRWRDPARFYGEFQDILLESGVAIYEVQATESFLEKAIGPTHAS